MRSNTYIYIYIYYVYIYLLICLFMYIYIYIYTGLPQPGLRGEDQGLTLTRAADDLGSDRLYNSEDIRVHKLCFNVPDYA